MRNIRLKRTLMPLEPAARETLKDINKMMYNKELMHYKRTNFRHPKGLITFEHMTPEKQQMSIFDRIIQQIVYFTKSIHGFSYVWERDLRFLMRLLWFFLVVGSIITCIVMYMSLASLHNKQQIKTVVATSQLPIYQINFPAIALCPWYHVNWSRRKAAMEKFLPTDVDTNTAAVFDDVLRVLNDMKLPSLNSLSLFENQTVPRLIDNIPLNDLANFMAFRCDELFVECIYAETKYDCCKIFVAEYTENGVCLVFNSMISEESKNKQITDTSYPWKNRKAGQGTGLQLTIRYNKTHERNHTDTFFGLSVKVKECEEWNEPLESCFQPNSKTYLAITPIIRETSSNTKHLDPRTRNCLFAEEKSELYDRIEGLRYNKLNCIVKCQQKNFIKTCHCTLSWFLPKANIFSYVKSPLQDEYIKDYRRGVTCDCIDSCYSLDLLTSFHTNMLPNPNASYYTTIQADIYIGQQVLTKYETRLHSTMFDLIAQFGGILGLCLGASVLSLAEVVYAGLKIVVLLLLTKYSQKQKIKPNSKGKIIKI